MMNFDDRTGKTQPVIKALEQETANSIQNLRNRKSMTSGLYPKTATPDQIVNSVIAKPRSL